MRYISFYYRFLIHQAAMRRIFVFIPLGVLWCMSCERAKQSISADKKPETHERINPVAIDTEDTLYRSRDYRIVGRNGAHILVSLKANLVTGSEKQLNTLFQNSEIAVLGDTTAEPLWIYQRFVARHQFADFPASIFRGKAAKPDFASNREAKNYKTRITEGAKEPANFAGHYRLTTWGCGSNCQRSAIVDLKTGKIFWAPYTAELLSYQTYSRLLLTDYVPEMHKGWYLINGIVPPPTYYIWTGKEFEKLD